MRKELKLLFSFFREEEHILYGHVIWPKVQRQLYLSDSYFLQYFIYRNTNFVLFPTNFGTIYYNNR